MPNVRQLQQELHLVYQEAKQTRQFGVGDVNRVHEVLDKINSIPINRGVVPQLDVDMDEATMLTQEEYNALRDELLAVIQEVKTVKSERQ